MKQYITIGILTIVLIALIALTTWVALNTVEIGDLSFLSINDMEIKKTDLETETTQLSTFQNVFETSKSNLQNAQNKYKQARDEYNNISEEDIEYIKEATKEDHYYVEWLWIVLGEYALDNNLTLTVKDPRTGSESSNVGTVQINVQGRYQDIANFVFEVENDDELRFKLDNMTMTATSATVTTPNTESKPESGTESGTQTETPTQPQTQTQNIINATFDVLSMEVLF